MHKTKKAALALATVLALGISPIASAHSLARDSSAQPPLVIVPSPTGNFQDNFSPFQGNQNYGTGGLIYQTLFYYNTLGPQVYPLLGVNSKWSNGNKTLTVNLQPKARWSDGKAFTSADVVFTFNLLKQYPAADTNGDWQQLQSVKAAGPHTVVFHFKTADVPFAWYVLGQTYIVPQHIWAKLGNPAKVAMTTPIGTGPYVLSDFSPQVYHMKTNPYFYGPKPAVTNLEFPAYSGNDSADMALAKGDIAWSGIFIPNIRQIYAYKSPHNKYWFPAGGIQTLYANLKNPNLKNLAVRRAISMAMNRQQMSTEGEYGYEGVPSPTGLILPANQPWLDKQLPKSDLAFSYNPNASIKLLEQAGYKRNKQGMFMDKKGKPLSFTLQVPTGWTDWDTDCQIIEENLKQIGINVSLQEEQFGAYYGNLNSHHFQLAMSWTVAGPTPYYLYYNMLSKTGNWNLEQWSNPKTEQALKAFQSTTNAAQQHRAINALEQQMAEQLPTIPVVFNAVWYEYNDANYTGWPTPSNPYSNPAPYTSPAIAVVLAHLHPVK